MERRFQAADWLRLAVSGLVVLLTVLNGEVRISGLREFVGALPGATEFAYDFVRWPMLTLACGALLSAALKMVTPLSASVSGLLMGVTLAVNLLWAWVWAFPCTPLGHSPWPYLLCGF